MAQGAAVPPPSTDEEGAAAAAAALVDGGGRGEQPQQREKRDGRRHRRRGCGRRRFRVAAIATASAAFFFFFGGPRPFLLPGALVEYLPQALSYDDGATAAETTTMNDDATMTTASAVVRTTTGASATANATATAVGGAAVSVGATPKQEGPVAANGGTRSGNGGTGAAALTDEWLDECVRAFPPEEIRPFEVKPGFDVYRLGDCIRICMGCKEGDNLHKLHLRRQQQQQQQQQQFGNGDNETISAAAAAAAGAAKFEAAQQPDDSLASLYQDMGGCPVGAPNHVAGGNLTLIEEIFRRKEERQQQQGQSTATLPFSKPDPDALVVHLRLGDQIDGSTATVREMLKRGAEPKGAFWKRGIKSAYEIVDAVRAASSSSSENGRGPVRKVAIVGGSHLRKPFWKSRVYAGCVKRAIEEFGGSAGSAVDVDSSPAGTDSAASNAVAAAANNKPFPRINVTMTLDGGDPDREFYYMSHASYFVNTVGGYSLVIAMLVQHMGGTVVGRMYPHQAR